MRATVYMCRVLHSVEIRDNGWAWFGAEFVTTSIDFLATSKLSQQ